MYTPPSEVAGACHPVQSRDGRAWRTADIRSITPGQGSCRTRRGNVPRRLVSELRLSGASTIDDANHVLEDFLPRFNNRFKVPAREQEVAYRAVDEGMCLLCFKYRRRVARDNTVRSAGDTLQLLPGTGRPSYAGAAVNVLEGLDGRLAVGTRHPISGSATASECPPGLRRENHALTHHPSAHQWSG